MFSFIRYTMSKVKMLHLLEEMKESSIETGSLCVPPKSSLQKIEEMIEAVGDTKYMPKELPLMLTESSTGGIVFWGPYHRYLVLPPFPVYKENVSRTCVIEPLHELLHRQLLLGLVLVRLGEYSIGVVKGEKVVSSKTGAGVVHARHRQGGSSSHRFERHREKQIETFFTRICGHVREQFEPYSSQFDYFLYGGTRETVTDFRKQCHFMNQFNNKTLERLLNVRQPEGAGLDEGITAAWSSQVIQWNEQ
jgi:hypothetical protein